MVGDSKEEKTDKFKINLLGEYNIGGDGFEIDRIFKKCGITNISTFSGNATYDKFASSNQADLSCVMCHRSINYVADMLETKYGIPWIKINFIGAEATAKSLRKIAKYFGDQKLIDRVETVIAEEMPTVESALKDVFPRTAGKTAMIFVGGSRAHHYQELFNELGMKTISAGYEFGHRDDYEGRHVIPTLKVDADSRNIEEIQVEADPELYKPRKTPEEIAALEKDGLEFKAYEGLNPDMESNTIVVDDLNQYEAEKLVELVQAIDNIFTVYEPEVIAVHTTCLSETIGDDLPQIFDKARKDKKVPEGKTVLGAPTPSYVGSHVTGFSNMVKAMAALATPSKKKNGKINVIPGWVEPSTWRKLRDLPL